MKRLLLSAVIAQLCSGQVLAASAKQQSNNEKLASQGSQQVETMRILGSSDGLRTEAGSATFIDQSELEKFEYDDINRILAKVPGVNIRQEDGFGLRPNIGFRGATPERSKKIALMEDGILIAPAPYSASAAYYFPMVSRMTGVEVFKGPASIKYGPNTVAGALNMVTRSVPYAKEGGIDLAYGSDQYNKLHVFYGDTIDNYGYLIEGINVKSDGFKDLDNGANTGFNKNSLMVKLNYDLSSKANHQLLELKLGYDDELSHESYLGLTDDDFALTPNRRYAASQNDLMDWTHSNALVTHVIELSDISVASRAYYNKFERSWNKLNGFSGDIKMIDVIAKPQDSFHRDFLEVITGERDSENYQENLVLGDNARQYYAWGLQTDVVYNLSLSSVEHTIEAGIRYHEDQIKRMHVVDYYAMRSGELVKINNNPPQPTTFNTETSQAVSVYVQDRISLDKLTLTAGIRGEYIDSMYQNSVDATDWQAKDSLIWLPGLSAFYQFNDAFGVLIGVNKGYVPTSPQQSIQIQPEESINYEIGARFNNGSTHGELVAFFNDFSNLKESCTFSASASCTVIDTEYNAGDVDIYGLEASLNHTVTLSDGIDMPLSMVYTYSKSEFKQSFISDFALWGEVSAGDEVPYMPEHQLTLSLELVGNQWQAALLAKHISEMKEISGTGDSFNFVGVSTAALNVVDFSSSYDISDDARLYFKIDNVFEAVEIISHRPYGARPNKPRQAMIGYKLSF